MSSRKGSEFERWFAKQLSLWWSQEWDEPRDDLFWRTSQSGGRSTVRARKGLGTKGHVGDIGPTCAEAEPLTNLVVFELKNGYSADTIHALLDAPDGSAKQEYVKWFEHAIDVATVAQIPYWMVVTKRTRRDPLVFIPHTLRIELGSSGLIASVPQVLVSIPICESWTAIHGFPLTRFFKSFQPKQFLEPEKKWCCNADNVSTSPNDGLATRKRS